MTSAQLHIMEKHRRGEPITPADVCATISSRTELAAYRDALKARGAFTSDAMSAIIARWNKL